MLRLLLLRPSGLLLLSDWPGLLLPSLLLLVWLLLLKLLLRRLKLLRRLELRLLLLRRRKLLRRLELSGTLELKHLVPGSPLGRLELVAPEVLVRLRDIVTPHRLVDGRQATGHPVPPGLPSARKRVSCLGQLHQPIPRLGVSLLDDPNWVLAGGLLLGCWQGGRRGGG